MAHFAISCPPLPGHLNPFCVLGRALERRGHKVTVFSVADAEPMVRRNGLRLVALGGERYPGGNLASAMEALKERQGLRSTLEAVQAAVRMLHMVMEHGPAALRQEGVDFVLADQNEPGMASVAEHIGLPFASICTSLPLNREDGIPPPFTGWPHGGGRMAQLRNRLGYAIADCMIRDVQGALNERRRQWGLAELRSPDDSFSKLAQVAQMPAEFDFPRRKELPKLHYAGPFLDERSDRADEFPWERLDGRPLVYASLGTLQSATSRHFHTMAEACTGLRQQVVISVGAAEGIELPKLPGNHLVVRYAPQLLLLRRAALTITHAGMNTTMQALHFGSPLIAIPLAHDQPAIAARLQRTGAGMVMGPRELTVRKLRAAIAAVLEKDSAWQIAAKRMQEAIRRAGGVERAADILEQEAPGQKRVQGATA